MVASRRFFNIILLSCSFIAVLSLSARADLPPQADPDPLAFAGQYEFTLGKLPLGKMGIEVRQDQSHYAITSDIVTTGLLNMFVKHSSHTTVTGSGRRFSYPDRDYETHYQTRKKKKYVKMVTRNGAVSETLIPPDNAAIRAPVTGELKEDAVDPLSLTIRMRQDLWHALKNHEGSFVIMLYDGRRLSELDFVLGDRRTLLYRGEYVPVVTLTLTRRLIAGFTQKELDERDPKEPPVRIFFTEDARMMLLRAEVSLWMGTLSANLTHECAAGESCLLGIQE